MAEPRRYSVPEVARLLGISERAVRKRITAGTLTAERDGPHWVVTLAELDGGTAAVPGGTEGGTSSGVNEPIEAAYTSPDAPTSALVPLAAVSAQLQGFADRLAELAERNEGLALEVGTLRERTATQQDTITVQAEFLTAERQVVVELRRRAEAAEAERDQLRQQAAPQPPSEAPSNPAPVPTPDAEKPAGGGWGWLRRLFRGEAD